LNGWTDLGEVRDLKIVPVDGAVYKAMDLSALNTLSFTGVLLESECTVCNFLDDVPLDAMLKLLRVLSAVGYRGEEYAEWNGPLWELAALNAALWSMNV
jgi:hypothetical protein